MKGCRGKLLSYPIRYPITPITAKFQDAVEGMSQQCMYCKSLWVKKGTQLKSDNTPIS